MDLDGGERGLVAHGFDGGGGEGEQGEEFGARGADGGVEGDALRRCEYVCRGDGEGGGG